MTLADSLITAKRTQPFQPFTIHLTDGKRVIVDRADCFILGHRGRTVVVNTCDDHPLSMAVIVDITTL